MLYTEWDLTDDMEYRSITVVLCQCSYCTAITEIEIWTFCFVTASELQRKIQKEMDWQHTQTLRQLMCSLLKEKFRKFYFEIEFRNKFPLWKRGGGLDWAIETCRNEDPRLTTRGRLRGRSLTAWQRKNAWCSTQRFQKFLHELRELK